MFTKRKRNRSVKQLSLWNSHTFPLCDSDRGIFWQLGIERVFLTIVFLDKYDDNRDGSSIAEEWRIYDRRRSVGIGTKLNCSCENNFS